MKQRKWSEASEVEELVNYIPENYEDRVKEFINSLEVLGADEALKEVNKYISFLIKNDVLAQKNEEEIMIMKKKYNNLLGEDFDENYTTNENFKGKGYSFFDDVKNPHLKVELLKISDDFPVPKYQKDKEYYKGLFLGALQVLLHDFYSRYEEAVSNTLESSN